MKEDYSDALSIVDKGNTHSERKLYLNINKYNLKKKDESPFEPFSV